MKVKKLIFVCGFNNYLGINEEYDNVNKSMYFDNLEDVKQYADEVATEQDLMPNGGHINSESGYDTFEDIVNYL